MLTVTFLITVSLHFLTTNCQLLYSPVARTWADAEADCEARGYALLTTQGKAAVNYSIYIEFINIIYQYTLLLYHTILYIVCRSMCKGHKFQSMDRIKQS